MTTAPGSTERSRPSGPAAPGAAPAVTVTEVVYPGQPKFPFVPGYDLVATVQSVGAGVRPGLAGQPILVQGANGGVGTTLVQLARHAGVRVIGTAAPRHHQALRELGALPVDYNDPDLAARVRTRLHAYLTTVLEPLADGTLTAQVAARLPLTRASEAMELAESRTVLGKVILIP